MERDILNEKETLFLHIRNLHSPCDRCNYEDFFRVMRKNETHIYAAILDDIILHIEQTGYILSALSAYIVAYTGHHVYLNIRAIICALGIYAVTLIY